MAQRIVLSYLHVEPLFHARTAGSSSATVSLDLGLSQSNVALGSEGVLFPYGQVLTWESLENIRASKTVCYALQDNLLEKIQRFSETTYRACSLMPTTGAPTLLLAGFPMHRIKNIDPYEDTVRKLKTLKPIRGRVLDTTTGLGYTAIEASKVAEVVITIELDPTVLEIAQFNPWSRGLFAHQNVSQLVGDSFEVIQEFHNGYFNAIIHDPPTVSLAGELYSETFYRQLFRVLHRGGKLFHYLGDLQSSLGRRVMKGAVRRLQDAGFGHIRPHPNAFGVVAHK